MAIEDTNTNEITQYNPTYYGPVAVKTAAGTTDVNDLTQGSLNCIVLQASDESPAYSSDEGSLTLKYKGPYNVMKNIANYWKIGDEINTALARSPLEVISRFSLPTPIGADYWTIQSVRIEESEKAGDHAYVTVKCLSYKNSSSGSASLTGETDPYSNTWNLHWESYTLTPYAFCSNESHEDLPMSASYEEDKNLPAMRDHIEAHLKKPLTGERPGYVLPGEIGAKYLNYAEQQVLPKVLENKNALWHYPILTHTETMNYTISSDLGSFKPPSYLTRIGDNIDHITEWSLLTADGCPYRFSNNAANSDWTWVKTGDEMSQVNLKEIKNGVRGIKVQYTRTLTWMGVISADINYYGNIAFAHDNLESCRWIPGQL